MSQSRTSRSVWKLLTFGLVLALLPTALFTGSAGAQAKSLTVGSKNFPGAVVVSQAYGQALENKGYNITFKDNLGPTEIVYAALKNASLEEYAEVHLGLRRAAAPGRVAAIRRATRDGLPGCGRPPRLHGGGVRHRQAERQ